MLKGDIKRHIYEKMGITTVEGANQNMLTGQTISKEEIYSFTSYKMMNDDERKIVNSILSSFKTSTQDIKTENNNNSVRESFVNWLSNNGEFRNLPPVQSISDPEKIAKMQKEINKYKQNTKDDGRI